jgi:hypothetical protein
VKALTGIQAKLAAQILWLHVSAYFYIFTPNIGVSRFNGLVRAKAIYDCPLLAPSCAAATNVQIRLPLITRSRASQLGRSGLAQRLLLPPERRSADALSRIPDHDKEHGA